jgi:hypothetical protein
LNKTGVLACVFQNNVNIIARMEWLSPEYAQYIMLLFLWNKRCCCFLNTEDYFMKGIKLLAATAALTVSSVAVAGPNYTYAQLGYIAIDSVANEDSGGFELNGSFGFADIFHVGGGIVAGELEGGKGKVNNDGEAGSDFDAFNIYVGVNPAMTDNVDAIVRVGYQEIETKASTAGVDDPRQKEESLFLEFGTRAMIAENFELNAFATYDAGNEKTDGGGAKEDFVDWGYRVGGIYSFTDMFAAGVKLEINEVNTGTLFARVNF